MISFGGFPPVGARGSFPPTLGETSGELARRATGEAPARADTRARGAALRAELVAAGVLRPFNPDAPPPRLRVDLGPVLRTDARGREVAALRRARGLWDPTPNFDQWS